MRKKPRNKLTLVFLLILGASTVLRLILCVFPKSAVTYYDELFYLELSQNIFLRGNLNVYGTQLGFSKLLYPVLLSPFYAISDGVLRTKMISAFNTVLISTSLIPGFFLARRILRKDWQVILSLLFLALSPNLLFSVTFMAENLYYPLLIWAFWAAYCYFSSKKRTPLRASLLGLFAFVLYFTKETGAAWVFALGTALLANAIIKKSSRKRAWLSLGCYLLGLAIPYLLLRLTLLSDLSYSYAKQASFSNLSNASHLMFFLYATGMMLLYFLVSILFFPAALPIVFSKKLSPANKILLLISSVYTIFLAAGIAFGVSLFSDFGRIEIRIHLRYFIGAAFPFLLLSLSLLEATEPVKWRSPLVVSTGAFAGLVLLFLIVPQSGSMLDSPVLQFLQKTPQDSLRWRWALRLAICVFLVVMLLLWNKKKKQVFVCLLLSLLLIFECFSGILFCSDARTQETNFSPAVMEDARKLDPFLDTLEGNLLMLTEDTHSPDLRITNTVLNDDYYLTTFREVKKLASGENSAVPNQINLQEQQIPYPLSDFTGEEAYNIYHIDYIITIGDFSLINPKENKEITPEGISTFHVYRTKKSSRLALLDPLVYAPGKTIFFFGQEPSFRDYRAEGFSGTENGFTWSAANEVSLTLIPNISKPCDLLCTWTWKMTIGEQPCQILANDIPVMDFTVSSTADNRCTFCIPAETYANTGILTLRFLFPEARQPGNGDPRILAVAFESLVLEAK